MEVRISVRGLVEFILRQGDIDNRRMGAPENAMQEGGRIHRMIQRRMGADYQAEVALSYRQETENYTLVVEGRADGIFNRPGEEMVDEIKGTYRKLSKLQRPVPVHLAQAKCYAYLYASQHGLGAIRVQMTYCNMETEDLKHFEEKYTLGELEGWFNDLISQYKKWADFQCRWREKRRESIGRMSFPFDYREGQKELATYVYRTVYHGRKLFIEAPTGAGKTVSTIFPAIKAMGEGLADRLFYLTAKTITGKVADDTVNLLRERGLCLKTVWITARDKVCFLDEANCNPSVCPYAEGHYDRVNEAMYELLTNEDNFSREKIEEYARRYRVCPFEFCLDMSLFADAIVCDYNYVFDPHVYLRRFFGEGAREKYIFLVDEAHNLVDRGREMYSAVLCKEDFLELKKVVRPFDAGMEKKLEKCNHELLIMKRECEAYRVQESIAPFAAALERLSGVMSEYLEEHDGGEVREAVLEFYFEVSHFLTIYDRIDGNYVVYSELEDDGRFTLKLFCVNPSVNLRECMQRARSSILFSATLLPIRYYKSLLGADEGDYEVYAKSVFNPERKGLFIGDGVTSRYARRSEEEYRNIARYLHEIVKTRYGNYMAFFPSHAFLRSVYEAYRESYQDEDEVECIVQESRMDDAARESFLGRFSSGTDMDLSSVVHMDIQVEEEKSLLGFCVLGGIFGEGIDLKNDSLIGAIIVGTGIPQVCNEREILKRYFDDRAGDGFDYAYRFPGMNKVLQAAGRVIRTAEDVGIVVLLDERFVTPSYRRLFPREWEHLEVVSSDRIARRIERFWDEWL